MSKTLWPLPEMSKKRRKNRKKRAKARCLMATKPSFGYYLLILFFPLMFFLIDNSFDIFKNKWGFDNDTLLNVISLLLFIGVPLFLFFKRRTIKLFEDRLIIHWPGLKKSKEYRIENLKKWEFLDFYVPNAGQQKYLYLWFNNSRKISINGIESNKFKQLVVFFEKVHGDKKRKRKTLFDKLREWKKNRNTGPNSNHI